MTLLSRVLWLIFFGFAWTTASVAGDLDRNDHCGLVPWVQFDSRGNTTAIGLTTFVPSRIFWAAFDGSGVNRASGSLQSDQLFTPFIAVAALPAATSDQPLFLLFCVDNNDGTLDGLITAQDKALLAVSAFYVEPAVNDVIYVPTAPLSASNLTQANPALWTQEPIGEIPGGATIQNRVLYGRYLVGEADRTRLYLWTAGNSAGQPAVAAYGDTQFAPLILTGRLALNPYLTVLDVGAVGLGGAALPSGFLALVLPNSATKAFGFTVISSPAFGAQQTLMMTVRNPVPSP